MAFEFLTPTRIIFGSGTVRQLPDLVAAFGKKVFVVQDPFFRGSEPGRLILKLLQPVGTTECSREPTVTDVEAVVQQARQVQADVLVGIGGGSVLDCTKAAAAMSRNTGELIDYLEGVGKGLALTEPSLPWIAVPTSAGTGSEVTKNAVISGQGYKKSLRGPSLCARIAVVDPELTLTLPPAITAASGMDALTQLIESYLSLRASPLTDGIALRGIATAGRSLARAFDQPDDLVAREGMSLAALMSGICLANAGLGAVHGIAAALGGCLGMPHGAACAALLYPVLQANVEAVRGSENEERVLSRVADIGRVLAVHGEATPSDSRDVAVDTALESLRWLREHLSLPSLGKLGMKMGDISKIVQESRGSSMKTNPVLLSDEQIELILQVAL